MTGVLTVDVEVQVVCKEWTMFRSASAREKLRTWKTNCLPGEWEVWRVQYQDDQGCILGLATPAAPTVPTFPNLKQVQPPMSDPIVLSSGKGVTPRSMLK